MLTRSLFIGLACLSTVTVFAQEEETLRESISYRVEAYGSVASDDNTPFWMVSNQYGLVPLEGNNGYLRAGVFHDQSVGEKFHWGVGLDVAVAAPRNKNVFIQQAYVEASYRCLTLTVGSKESYHTSLVDQRLSSGDITHSSNARPIPEVNISIPTFTIVPLTKGWMQVKGDFAVGRSFDKGYLDDFANETQTYVYNALWHHKSFFVRIKDTRNGFPLSGVIGVQHWAQWGGTSTNSSIGSQPHSLKDFIRVVMGKEGGEDATSSDQINVLGNHYGSYDFKLTYTQPRWEVSAYYQHIFEDKSGMIFKNKTDGLWGIQLDLSQFTWLRKVVVEYLNTRDQSGTFHYLNFDHDVYAAVGGGADDYYNNGEYKTGASYFNRSLGTPLLLSPEYNGDGSLGFKSTRVRDWHIGAEGDLSSQVSYRFLLTVMNNWGRHSAPLLEKEHGVSTIVDITYKHPRLSGWTFTGSVGLDTGTMLGDNVGVSLRVSKQGILKRWK